METIQLAIANAPYASVLRHLLLRNGAEVVCVDTPDPNREGVMVLDPEHLEMLRFPLKKPERIVLIARKEPRHLSRAWDVGVHSVVFESDPMDTAVLAVMSARLRTGKARSAGGG